MGLNLRQALIVPLYCTTILNFVCVYLMLQFGYGTANMGASRQEYHLVATNLAMASHVLDLENMNPINSHETVKNDLSKIEVC